MELLVSASALLSDPYRSESRYVRQWWVVCRECSTNHDNVTEQAASDFLHLSHLYCISKNQLFSLKITRSNDNNIHCNIATEQREQGVKQSETVQCGALKDGGTYMHTPSLALSMVLLTCSLAHCRLCLTSGKHEPTWARLKRSQSYKSHWSDEQAKSRLEITLQWTWTPLGLRKPSHPLYCVIIQYIIHNSVSQRPTQALLRDPLLRTERASVQYFAQLFGTSLTYYDRHWRHWRVCAKARVNGWQCLRQNCQNQSPDNSEPAIRGMSGLPLNEDQLFLSGEVFAISIQWNRFGETSETSLPLRRRQKY